MSCRVALERIDRLLLGELRPSEWAQLKGHLEGCAACRQQYNRAVFTLRQLTGSPSEVAPEEWALLGPLVSRPQREPRRWGRWLLGASALPIGVAVLLNFIVGPPLPDAGEVQPRGGVRSGPGLLALRAYCVSELEPGLRVVASSDRKGALQCSKGELLQFAYRLEGEPRWLHLAGVDAEGRVLRYYPRPTETAPRRLEPTSVEQPLGASFRLEVRHHPGVVHVVGLLTAAPLSAEEGDAQVARALRTGDGATAGDELVRLTLEVLP